jgi:hypothetical protein
MADSLDVARVEAKLDRLLDRMMHVRFDLDDLRTEMRQRDATTAEIVAALRRTVGVLRRLVRSVHGDGRSGWWNQE